MQRIRAITVPLLLMVALVALAWLDVKLPSIAFFSFIWDIILGAVLGAGLALLPAASGYKQRKNALTGMFWVCGFLTLLLIFFQYMTLVTGLKIEALTFLAEPNGRMRIIEGAFLGYCSFTAGRGKI